MYTLTLEVEITFVGPSHVAPGAKTNFIYQAANDWNVLSDEVKAFLTF